MGFIRSSNRSLLFDSQPEDSNGESYEDRAWHCRLEFCAKAGRSHDPFLNQLSAVGREVIIGSFVTCLVRTDAQWEKRSGEIAGKRRRPMVASTVREATSHLAMAFRNHLQPSPMHIEGSAQLLHAAHSLFKAFEHADPAPKQSQRTITPKLLQGMYGTFLFTESLF